MGTKRLLLVFFCLTLFMLNESHQKVMAQQTIGWSKAEVVDPTLDLASQLSSLEVQDGAGSVPYAPRLVVGQGEDSSNQTMIRVLNRYGIPELQFLAYPPEITGGVRVNAGFFLSPQVQIVASPLSSNQTRQIRIFNQSGVMVESFEPETSLAPPFVVTTGDFFPQQEGDEIAVTSRNQVSSIQRIHFYTGTGIKLSEISLGLLQSGQTDTISCNVMHLFDGDALLITLNQLHKGYAVNPVTKAMESVDMSQTPSSATLYESAFADQGCAATFPETVFSQVHTFDTTFVPDTITNVAERENKFWIDPVKYFSSPVFTFDSDVDGWCTPSSSMLVNHADGQLILSPYNATVFDPYVIGPAVSYNADQYGEFAMSVNLSGVTQSIPSTIFWYCSDGSLGLAQFQINPGQQTVRFNLSAQHETAYHDHTGTITNLRLDIPDGLVYSSVAGMNIKIDWLAVSNDTNFTPTQQSSVYGDYIQSGRFRHLRTDASSPGYAGADFSNTDYDYWAGGTFNDYIESTQYDYDHGVPSIWEPTFSHRQFVGFFDNWKQATDSGTGFASYMALTRLNTITNYSEVGNTYEVMTYAPGRDALNRLLEWPLRAYLRALAPKFRNNPDQMIALEPNHEFEIVIADGSSIGDYNTAMIDGFYDYLIMLYTTMGRINSRFGTSFTSHDDFDAPRNQGRAGWDAYSSSNAFFVKWVEFQRKVVFERIAQGMRESLFAGFPPEIIKTHQIPADYAIGDVLSSQRISPIDWCFATGTGYGGTRYGLWYENTSNWIQGALSSGQNMIGVGEYHPLTTDLTKATGQFDYMFTHGVQYVQHMTWDNATYNQVAKQAWQSVAAQNIPRPGTTGGTGALRAVSYNDSTAGSQIYNIVQVGEGSSHNGLLKSISADGSWDGTVYVTPFQHQIILDTIDREASVIMSTEQYFSGSITGLQAGDQIEVSFWACTGDTDGKLTMLMLHSGVELTGHRNVINIGSDWQFNRYILRIQEPMEEMNILINSGERDTPTGFSQTIELKDFIIMTEREQCARIEFGVSQGTPHAGGVTFDILSSEYIPQSTMANPFPSETSAELSCWRLD